MRVTCASDDVASWGHSHIARGGNDGLQEDVGRAEIGAVDGVARGLFGGRRGCTAPRSNGGLPLPGGAGGVGGICEGRLCTAV